MIKRAEDQEEEHRRGQALSPWGHEGSAEKQKTRRQIGKRLLLHLAVSYFSLIRKKRPTGQMRGMFAHKCNGETDICVL